MHIALRKHIKNPTPFTSRMFSNKVSITPWLYDIKQLSAAEKLNILMIVFKNFKISEMIIMIVMMMYY